MCVMPNEIVLKDGLRPVPQYLALDHQKMLDYFVKKMLILVPKIITAIFKNYRCGPICESLTDKLP